MPKKSVTGLFYYFNRLNDKLLFDGTSHYSNTADDINFESPNCEGFMNKSDCLVREFTGIFLTNSNFFTPRSDNATYYYLTRLIFRSYQS